MEEGGEEDSYGEEEDGEEILGVNDVTSQLAAAGWQHGVHLFIFFIYYFFNFLTLFSFILFWRSSRWSLCFSLQFSMPRFLCFTCFTLFYKLVP